MSSPGSSRPPGCRVAGRWACRPRGRRAGCPPAGAFRWGLNLVPYRSPAAAAGLSRLDERSAEEAEPPRDAEPDARSFPRTGVDVDDREEEQDDSSDLVEARHDPNGAPWSWTPRPRSVPARGRAAEAHPRARCAGPWRPPWRFPRLRLRAERPARRRGREPSSTSVLRVRSPLLCLLYTSPSPRD